MRDMRTHLRQAIPGDLHLGEDVRWSLLKSWRTLDFEPHWVVEKDDEGDDEREVFQVLTGEPVLTHIETQKPIGCCQPTGMTNWSAFEGKEILIHNPGHDHCHHAVTTILLISG